MPDLGLEYIYVNTQVKNQSDTPLRAVCKVRRATPILPETGGLVKFDKWLSSIDRFYISGAILPLFKAVGDYTISITDGNTTESQNVAFTLDSNNFLYDYHQFAEDINTTFDALSTTLGINQADIPVITFNDDTNKFTINTTANFRGTYNIIFDNNLYFCLNTFRTEQTAIDENTLILLEDAETQHSNTLENLSPVNKILLVSNMPLRGELMPSSISPDSQALSSVNLNIITDFKYYQESNTKLNSIIFNANASHRYHTLISTLNFTSFDVEFYWVDRDNNNYALNLAPIQGMCEAKIMFVSINENLSKKG